MADLVKLQETLNNEGSKKKFGEMLGKKAPGFMASIMSVVRNNQLLQKADNNSILMAAGIAASIDLPIVPALKMAAIVPYGNEAQFQIMRNGLVDLAMRSGQYATIINEPVHEGELVKHNKFTGEYVFDEDKKVSDKIIGYMAYFRLVNGFEKTLYWTVDECRAHGKKYSKTFSNPKGLWMTDFDGMALKTVLKRLLDKFGPKSIEMQTAMIFDQARVKGNLEHMEDAEAVYIDNQQDPADEAARFMNANGDNVEDVNPVTEESHE